VSSVQASAHFQVEPVLLLAIREELAAERRGADDLREERLQPLVVVIDRLGAGGSSRKTTVSPPWR